MQYPMPRAVYIRNSCFANVQEDTILALWYGHLPGPVFSKRAANPDISTL